MVSPIQLNDIRVLAITMNRQNERRGLWRTHQADARREGTAISGLEIYWRCAALCVKRKSKLLGAGTCSRSMNLCDDRRDDMRVIEVGRRKILVKLTNQTFSLRLGFRGSAVTPG